MSYQKLHKVQFLSDVLCGGRKAGFDRPHQLKLVGIGI